MKPEELQEIIGKHVKWLNNEPGGERWSCPWNCDLRRADLIGANLRRANLRRADLRRADLRRADLIGADLSGADLSGANLSRADLIRANLSRADLSGADLSGANLSRADLSGSDLSGADLSRADLSGADLRGANLREADLSGANLSGADLSGAENAEQVEAYTNILPAGTLTVYKKAECFDKEVLLTLEIPAEAKRSNATGRKCRAEYAILRGVEGIGWEYDGTAVNSKLDNDFIYPEIGEMIIPNGWDENRWNECSRGVHFFITRYEAENY